MCALTGSVGWIEMRRDDTAFLAFLAELVAVLDGPMPPSMPVVRVPNERVRG